MKLKDGTLLELKNLDYCCAQGCNFGELFGMNCLNCLRRNAGDQAQIVPRAQPAAPQDAVINMAPAINGNGVNGAADAQPAGVNGAANDQWTWRRMLGMGVGLVTFAGTWVGVGLLADNFAKLVQLLNASNATIAHFKSG